MRILRAVAAAILTLAMGSAIAQTYPARNVLFISGVTDTIARPLFERVKQNTGATFIFEPRQGGAGALALQALKRAEPDGYTFGVTASSAILHTIVTPELGIDPLADFVAVANLVTLHVLVAAREDFPANDLRDVVAMAKAKPGSVRFGLTSTGTRLSLAMLEERAGVKFLQVPYKSGTDTAIALLGGHVDISVENLGGIVRQKGKIKPLSYGGPTRSPQFPSVPTMREMYQFDIVAGAGSVLAPAGTPAPAVNWVNRELIRALKSPEIMKLLDAVGFFPIGSSPEEYANSLRTDVSEYREILRKYPDIR